MKLYQCQIKLLVHIVRSHAAVDYPSDIPYDSCTQGTTRWGNDTDTANSTISMVDTTSSAFSINHV